MVIDDRWDVLDVRTKLVQGIDRRNWVQFRSCITDTVRLDYSAHDPNRIPGSIAGDRWTAYCRTLFAGLDATQHSLTNPLVHITGETACTWWQSTCCALAATRISTRWVDSTRTRSFVPMGNGCSPI